MRKRLLVIVTTICLVGSIVTSIYIIKKNSFNKKEIVLEAKKQTSEEKNETNEIVKDQTKSNLNIEKPVEKLVETKKADAALSEKSNSETIKRKEQSKPKEQPKTTVKQNNKSKEQPTQKPVVQAPQQPKSGIAATKIAQKTNKIIWVSGNKLTFWEKGSDGNWNCSLTTNSRHGYGGFTSNKREGDGATPTGVYPILYAFGTGGNPGTKISYRRITNNSYFVDDSNSKYYNQWFEGTGEKGEHLASYSTQYKYGMVIGYNTSYTPNKGSAIFLHCNGKGNTAGCVSVDENTMLTLMKRINGQAYIIITTNDNNLKYY